MSYKVYQTQGYGFAFSENFLGIAPAQLLAFLDHTPFIKKKLQDNNHGFLEKIVELMREGKGLAGEEEELDDLLDNYEGDFSSENELAALYVDTVKEAAGIRLEVQRDDEKGIIVMLPAAVPWQYSSKELQLEGEEHLSAVLKACCDETGIICNTDVEFIIAENWG